MSISYIIAFCGLFVGGVGNYLAAFVMVFVSIAALFEFVFYREFLDPFFKKTEGRNIIGRIEPEREVFQTLIFSAHYLQNIQKNYILIVTMTLLFYFFGLFLSIGAMLFQILTNGVFTCGLFWLFGMAVGLIFLLPYYFFITREVSPGVGDNLISVAILLQLAEYFNKTDNVSFSFLIVHILFELIYFFSSHKAGGQQRLFF